MPTGNQKPTFKCLFHVDGLLGTRFEIRDVALGLAKRHCALRRYHALVLFDIDLVANHHLCDRQQMGFSIAKSIAWAGLTNGKFSGSRGLA